MGLIESLRPSTWVENGIVYTRQGGEVHKFIPIEPENLETVKALVRQLYPLQKGSDPSLSEKMDQDALLDLVEWP